MGAGQLRGCCLYVFKLSAQELAGREELEFVPVPPPSAVEVVALTEKIAWRITKRVRKLMEEEEGTKVARVLVVR